MTRYRKKPVEVEAWQVGSDEPKPEWVTDSGLIPWGYQGDNAYYVKEGDSVTTLSSFTFEQTYGDMIGEAIDDRMSFYRFPAMAKLSEWSNEQQATYILSEAEEAKSAQSFMDYGEGSGDRKQDRMDYGIELMDVIHSAETALRMEFTDQEIAQLQDKVIEKNRARGYYG